MSSEQYEQREVIVAAEGTALAGSLTLPRPTMRGVVIFAHGSGSGRLSPRNQQVAAYLNSLELGTLLFDLLTKAEHEIDQRTGELRFDIALLSQRLIGAVDWLNQQVDVFGLAGRWGLFGASTGAAAALVTAAVRPGAIAAVVSRGGRPDLAGAALTRVRAPTLLIVGGDDTEVLALNEQAAQQLAGPRRTAIVPGATHLFEEPGKLEAVAQLAGTWFLEHLNT